MQTIEQRYDPPAKRRKEKAKIAARDRRTQESKIISEMAKELSISQEQAQRIDKASIVRLAISYIKAIKALEELSRLHRQLPITIESAINYSAYNNNNNNNSINTNNSKTHRPRVTTKTATSLHNCNQLSSDLSGDFSGSRGSENQPPAKAAKSTTTTTTVLTAKHNNTKTLSTIAAIDLTNTTTKALTTAAPFNNASTTTTTTVASASASVASNEQQHQHLQTSTSPSQRFHTTNHNNNTNNNNNNNSNSNNSNTTTPTVTTEPVFISHHSADLKFIYIDENVKSLVEFEPELLLGKSLLQFIHVFDTQQLYGSYKALLSKDHTKTGYYRFIAKHGGFVWLLTEASIVNRDDYGKPKIIACVNHVMSGIKDKNIIISSKQVAALPPNTQQPQQLSSPTKITANNNNNNNSIKAQQPVADLQSTIVHVPDPLSTQPINTDLLPHSVPHLNTYKIFAPKTEDMNSCFLMINDEDGAAILLPDTEVEQEDLTHLAPQAGDVSVPLDVEPLDGIILDQNSPFLQEPTKVPIIDSLDIFIDGSIGGEPQQLQHQQQQQQQQHHHHHHQQNHHNNNHHQHQQHHQHHQQQQQQLQQHQQHHHHQQQQQQHSLSLQQSCDKQDYLIYDYSSCLGISPSPPPLEAMSSSVGILDNDSDTIIMNGIMNSSNIKKLSWDRNQQVNDSFLSDEDLQACMMSTPFSNDIGLDFDPVDDDEDDNLIRDKSQHQPDQQINTFRHSVLLNLLVDGSDIAAGYTSKNSRAVTMKHVCSSMH